MHDNKFCGEVWLVDLDPIVGREQAKKRPCLVVTADIFNQGPGELVGIVPLTSVFRPLQWYVQLSPPEGGTNKTSFIMCHQLRMVSSKRFSGKRLGVVSNKTLENVRIRLRYLFSL